MNTIDRIKLLMSERRVSAHKLEIEANLAISSINGWSNGKFNPSAEAIKRIAVYFGVSTDYLLCLTDIPDQLWAKDDGSQ